MTNRTGRLATMWLAFTVKHECTELTFKYGLTLFGRVGRWFSSPGVSVFIGGDSKPPRLFQEIAERAIINRKLRYDNCQHCGKRYAYLQFDQNGRPTCNDSLCLCPVCISKDLTVCEYCNTVFKWGYHHSCYGTRGAAAEAERIEQDHR